MELKEFLDFVKTGKALNTPEIYEFMDRMSDEARKITFELNSSYHEADEVREAGGSYVQGVSAAVR